ERAHFNYLKISCLSIYYRPIGDEDKLRHRPMGQLCRDRRPGDREIRLLPDAETAFLAGGQVKDGVAHVGAEHGAGIVAIDDDRLIAGEGQQVVGGVAGLGEGAREILFICVDADEDLEGEDGVADLWEGKVGKPEGYEEEDEYHAEI